MKKSKTNNYGQTISQSQSKTRSKTCINKKLESK